MICTEVYVCQCGKGVMRIARSIKRKRARGHRKHLYCPFCKKVSMHTKVSK